ncbi:MAG TPA: hypothetical protein VK874_13215, partial [Gaiellaceae bacterium]|nr:hypothetical protein [Gaiellaceae bacterium]
MGGVVARLLREPGDGLLHVPVRRPRVRGGSRDCVVAEVAGGDAAVGGGAIEVLGRVVEEPSG